MRVCLSVCVRACMCGLEAMESSDKEGPQRFRARCQRSQRETCVYPHTSSSDLGGHLLQSGSLAMSAWLGSKVSPRQPHRIIPFRLIPPRNCVWRDWPVPPGALRRRLRRCLLTRCVSYGSESVCKERAEH